MCTNPPPVSAPRRPLSTRTLKMAPPRVTEGVDTPVTRMELEEGESEETIYIDLAVKLGDY